MYNHALTWTRRSVNVMRPIDWLYQINQLLHPFTFIKHYTYQFDFGHIHTKMNLEGVQESHEELPDDSFFKCPENN